MKKYIPVYETAKETLMYRTVFWTLWERERVGLFERMALKHVYYHIWNESPVQVRSTIRDAWGWCTGTTQRDGTGREEGGGFRMGNMCIPVADSCWCMAKPIQYCQVKKKKEKKRNPTGTFIRIALGQFEEKYILIKLNCFTAFLWCPLIDF